VGSPYTAALSQLNFKTVVYDLAAKEAATAAGHNRGYKASCRGCYCRKYGKWNAGRYFRVRVLWLQ
jgi:hypothetical protein